MNNWTVILPLGTEIPDQYHYYKVGYELMIPALFESTARRIIQTSFADVKGVFAEPKPLGYFADKVAVKR